jgi:NAD(P)-dependent dehydrogenase (short-subunit alcohol dehydrogenase family)
LSGARSLAIITNDLPAAINECREMRQEVRLELGGHDDEISPVSAFECDIADPEQLHSTIDEIGTKFGEIDIFVGAAGRSHDLIDLTNDREFRGGFSVGPDG